METAVLIHIAVVYILIIMVALFSLWQCVFYVKISNCGQPDDKVSDMGHSWSGKNESSLLLSISLSLSLFLSLTCIHIHIFADMLPSSMSSRAVICVCVC